MIWQGTQARKQAQQTAFNSIWEGTPEELDEKHSYYSHKGVYVYTHLLVDLCHLQDYVKT